MSENEKKVRNDYAEFLAKQEARKTASHDRITAKMKTIDKDISAKYIPNNLKIIAGLTVGQVQQVSDASDVPVDVEAGKMPPFYLYPPRINAIQVVTTPDDVAYILVKGDEDTEDKYVLTDNFDVYNKLGEPNKLIVVTTPNDVLNVPVVEEESSASSETSDSSISSSEESTSESSEESSSSSEESSSESSEESSSSSEESSSESSEESSSSSEEASVGPSESSSASSEESTSSASE